jgi:hypothetical protein
VSLARRGIFGRNLAPHSLNSRSGPDSIIELHDGGGDRTATLAALPAIVRGIRHRHLRLIALTP